MAKTTEVPHLVSIGLRMRGLDPGPEIEEETGCSRDVFFVEDAESTMGVKIDQIRVMETARMRRELLGAVIKRQLKFLGHLLSMSVWKKTCSMGK